MRKFIIIFALSCIASLLFCDTLQNVPYEEALIKIQFRDELGDASPDLTYLPIELQALLLDYARNKELLLKSRIALLKYPQQAEKTLQLYGADTLFQNILLRYGEITVPITSYFFENESSLLEVGRQAENRFFQFATKLRNLWDKDTGGVPVTEFQHIEKLDSVQRGWLAINFINNEGYDFIGQFAINENKEVKWIQTERFLENLNAFFAGGIRNLETKIVLNEKLTGYDYLMGAVDVAVIGGTLKLLRAGRVASKSGKSVGFATRTQLFAPRLFAGGGLIVRKIATYGAVAATAYVVATHPFVLHGMMAEIANGVGIPPTLFQFVGWFLLLFILAYPLFWLFQFLLRPTIWILTMSTGFLAKLGKHLRYQRD
ncbi:MAG: hypothetical protein DWQ10_11395 [Calditrichaeota bacterium]|nr:MAG: hypothetical protein DWQ10_11395 [Calditrichota bacterium]